MTFLYPKARIFPFDPVSGQIVRALEARGWKVPGMTVELKSNPAGNYVGCVSGDSFRLEFGRRQARVGQWNDLAAVSEITIPRRKIKVYDDNSGPTFYVYVGKNWTKDRHGFTNGSKLYAQLGQGPRTYLKYTGACRCGSEKYDHRHNGVPPLLVHFSDREFELETGDPAVYDTSVVMNEFTQWLKTNVLDVILAQPVTG